MDAKQMLSFKTPRGPLRWSVLTALIFLTLGVLWLVWAVSESAWIQWIVVTASVLMWNLLVIRTGERRTNQSDAQQTPFLMAVPLFAGTMALFALAAFVVTVSQNSALFLGREAIYFMVISVPLMIWVNVHLRGR